MTVLTLDRALREVMQHGVTCSATCSFEPCRTNDDKMISYSRTEVYKHTIIRHKIPTASTSAEFCCYRDLVIVRAARSSAG